MWTWNAASGWFGIWFSHKRHFALQCMWQKWTNQSICQWWKLLAKHGQVLSKCPNTWRIQGKPAYYMHLYAICIKYNWIPWSPRPAKLLVPNLHKNLVTASWKKAVLSQRKTTACEWKIVVSALNMFLWNFQRWNIACVSVCWLNTVVFQQEFCMHEKKGRIVWKEDCTSSKALHWPFEGMPHVFIDAEGPEDCFHSCFKINCVI